MTDKEKIRAEIERLKESGCASPIVICDTLLAFIDSMQEEPVSKDLEEEIEAYWKNAPTGTVYFPMWEHFQIIAHHFAEWGKKQAEIEIQAQSMALAHGCPKEPVSEDLEKAARSYSNNIDNICGSMGKQTRNAFKAGAEWQKSNLWKPADGDDLPEYDREVVVFTQNFPDDAGMIMVAFGHRPNPDGWDGKSLSTGKVKHYTPKTYDKGGWNIPDVKFWLDVELPKETEL